ncbi:hypothetical protein JCM8097_009450 [Rhodosporidiobolus ruineniae]
MFAARVGLRAPRQFVQRRFASAQANAGPKQKTLWDIWYEPAALPIFAVVGTACFGAGWWDRRGNPEPWNKIEQGTLVKLYTNHPE